MNRLDQPGYVARASVDGSEAAAAAARACGLDARLGDACEARDL